MLYALVATDSKSEGSHNRCYNKSKELTIVTDGKSEGSHNIYNTCVFIILIIWTQLTGWITTDNKNKGGYNITNDGKID